VTPEIGTGRPPRRAEGESWRAPLFTFEKGFACRLPTSER
jgi:hypothetical protein